MTSAMVKIRTQPSVTPRPIAAVSDDDEDDDNSGADVSDVELRSR